MWRIPATTGVLAACALAMAAEDATSPPAVPARGVNCATDGKSDVRVRALSVGMPQELLDDPESSYEGGVRITFRVARADADILGFLGDRARVQSFVDDQGNNMSGAKIVDAKLDDEGKKTGEEEIWQPAVVESWDTVDERRADFVIWTPKAPSDVATRLKLRMTVALTLGFDARETETVALKLEPEATAQAGLFPVRVTGIEEEEPGRPIAPATDRQFVDKKPPAQLVSLEISEGKRRWVKDVKVFDAEGRVPSSFAALDSAESPDGLVSSCTVALARKAKDVRVTVVYYDRVEDVEVPIAASVGVGF